MDPSQTTAASFLQLRYDGGITLGLYSRSEESQEPFPPHTEVYLNQDTIVCQGFVHSIHIPSDDPTSRPEYTIRLASGAFVQAAQSDLRLPSEALESLSPLSDPPSAALPPWIALDNKVTVSLNGAMVRGYLSFDACHRWCFEQRSRHGKLIQFLPLFALPHTWEQRIIDGSFIPGWQCASAFCASHVSAATLASACPTTLRQALVQTFPDRLIWYSAYEEEHSSLLSDDTFVVIDEATYLSLRSQYGNALPTMCVLCIKVDSTGRPVRAKCVSLSLVI